MVKHYDCPFSPFSPSKSSLPRPSQPPASSFYRPLASERLLPAEASGGVGGVALAEGGGAMSEELQRLPGPHAGMGSLLEAALAGWVQRPHHLMDILR